MGKDGGGEGVSKKDVEGCTGAIAGFNAPLVCC